MELFVSKLRGIRVRQGIEGGEGRMGLRMFLLQSMNWARYRMAIYLGEDRGTDLEICILNI